LKKKDYGCALTEETSVVHCALLCSVLWCRACITDLLYVQRENVLQLLWTLLQWRP